MLSLHVFYFNHRTEILRLKTYSTTFNRFLYMYMYINNIAAPTANKAYTRNVC